ncbi:hypothetical protein FRB94_005673 [Tulasnella sp. JGI-2019a]|nr:hypothetical protein FRB94_005673 [Tulasnella sp. JGI-2019a]
MPRIIAHRPKPERRPLYARYNITTSQGISDNTIFAARRERAPPDVGQNCGSVDVHDPISEGPTLSLQVRRSHRRLRGSETSDSSFAASSFRECFNSSSSGSDGDDLISGGSLAAAVSVEPSPSISGEIGGVVDFGKTQRRIRRAVDSLIAYTGREPITRLLSAQSEANDAAAALSSLAASPGNKAEIVRRFTKGATTRARVLRVLCALLDSKADAEVPLLESSSEARLLDMVMEMPKMGQTVTAYLANRNVVGGAMGIRHLIKTMPPTIQHIPNLGTLLLSYVDHLAFRWGEGHGVEADSCSIWSTFRLLELILRRRIVYFGQLRPRTLYTINYSLSYIHDQHAPFHVVRAFSGTPPHGFRPQAMCQALYETVTNPHNLHGYVPNDTTRCLAFSALAAVLRGRYFSPTKALSVSVQTIVDVVLWKTSWQHSFPKGISRNWDIPDVTPHDDAYTMLSLLSPSKFIPIFHKAFKAAISDGSYKILEPLTALIVIHSAEPDAFWPTMLSALIQAGLVDYLVSVAAMEAPGQEDRLYRVVQEAKRDAVTGILRCFEQMSRTDSNIIGWKVFHVLEKLVRDEAQPLPVQDTAKIALRTWDLNMGIRPRKYKGIFV